MTTTWTNSLLTDTCSIERFTSVAVDTYGAPVKTWASHLASVPCRLVSTNATEVKVGAEVVIADYVLFIKDVDVTEQDRVVSGSVTYEILVVKFRKDATGIHHKELLLRAVR